MADDSDNDSAFGERPPSPSLTQPLTRSVTDYPYENGRRYHALNEGQYPFPNDAQEQDRMDHQHEIYKMIFHGALHKAPLPPRVDRALDIGCDTGSWAYRALDIGCGTGTWAYEFADRRPDTKVTGNKLTLSRCRKQYLTSRKVSISRTSCQTGYDSRRHEREFALTHLQVPPNLHFEVDDLESD